MKIFMEKIIIKKWQCKDCPPHVFLLRRYPPPPPKRMNVYVTNLTVWKTLYAKIAVRAGVFVGSSVGGSYFLPNLSPPQKKIRKLIWNILVWHFWRKLFWIHLKFWIHGQNPLCYPSPLPPSPTPSIIGQITGSLRIARGRDGKRRHEKM